MLVTAAANTMHALYRRACCLSSDEGHAHAMQASSFVGAAVNVKRIPEKWFHDAAAAAQGKRVAGLFDYWLNSHQIMHVMVTISILNLWLAADNDYQYWAAMGQGSCLAPGMSTS